MDIDENNTNETRLEVEFRQILCIIKKTILYVNSSYNLSFYRAWLEKLNSACADKYLRNTYLIRLARQIQGNFLSHPFDKTPPSGPLKIEDIYSEDSDVAMDSVRNGDESFPHEYQRLLQVKATPMSSSQRNLAFLFHNKNSSFNDQVVDDNEWKKVFQPSDDVAEHFEKEMPAKIKKRKLKSNNYKIHEAVSDDHPHPLEEPVRDSRKGKLGNIQEDSSWYDLTDTSLTSIILNPLGSGDAARRTKLPVFKDKIDESETNVDTSMKELQISPIPYEEQGNEEYQETTEMKFPLKDTHYISTDWKQTIGSLQLRLTETLTQNNDLKLTVGNLKAQIQAETKKREEIEQYLRELKEQHMKEIQKFDKMKEENKRKLEESFQQKLQKAQECYNEKLQELTNNYESKIKTLEEDNDCIRQDKDKEIIRLSHNIQEQCSRITDEIKELRKQMETLSSKNNNSDEKVIDLQRCISKMDKLFHKSEKEYLKQIEKLKQELTKQEKVAQLQLKTQKAELISRSSAEKQRQFDELVNNLEVKYIKMLEYHETEVMENRKEDEDRIKYLKHLLQKYDIPYNIS